MKIYKVNKGFSLVEVIFVIVVLAIFIGIAVATYPKLVQNSKIKSDKASATSIAKALRGWYEDGMSDPQKCEEFKTFIADNFTTKTIKLSELESLNVSVFVDPNTRPYSLLDFNDNGDDSQEFYVGMIGDGSSAKFIITVETEDKRLESVSESSTVNYDGTDIGVIYIES